MTKEILKFIEQVDSDFTTPMSERVNLKQYVEKLINNASIISITTNNSIVGMVAIYCNNLTTGVAYIPFVAIKSDLRGKGLSRALMLSAISMAKSQGFKRIGLHTDSQIAINLYTSLGFIIIENSDRKYLELNI